MSTAQPVQANLAPASPKVGEAPGDSVAKASLAVIVLTFVGSIVGGVLLALVGVSGGIWVAFPLALIVSIVLAGRWQHVHGVRWLALAGVSAVLTIVVALGVAFALVLVFLANNPNATIYWS